MDTDDPKGTRVLDGGSAELGGKVVVSGFPVGRRQPLRWNSDFCFSPALILASDSPTPSAGSWLGFLHSECGLVTNSTLPPSPEGAKLPETYTWKYLTRAINSGLCFPQKKSHFWSAVLMGGLESKYLLLLYWLSQSLWLYGSQQTVENGNTKPPDLPPEKSVCRSRSNS